VGETVSSHWIYKGFQMEVAFSHQSAFRLASDRNNRNQSTPPTPPSQAFWSRAWSTTEELIPGEEQGQREGVRIIRSRWQVFSWSFADQSPVCGTVYGRGRTPIVMKMRPKRGDEDAGATTALGGDRWRASCFILKPPP